MTSGRQWTTSEIEYLKTHSKDGAAAIAESLARSVHSVRDAASRQIPPISLRRPGERRGLILTQPRAHSWRERGEIRAAVLEQGFDITESIARLSAERDSSSNLCPRCSQRLVTKKSTGLCDVCHFNGLAQAWRQKKAAGAAEREYRREKKAGRRRVSCSSCGDEYSPRLDREGRKSDRDLCPKCRAGEPV